MPEEVNLPSRICREWDHAEEKIPTSAVSAQLESLAPSEESAVQFGIGKKLLTIFPPSRRFCLDTCVICIYICFNCSNICSDGKIVTRENRQMATKKAPAKKAPAKKAAKKAAKKK
ncbi:MAG: hypothetical protein ACLPM3_09015 [Terracidiphilus sp.]